MERGNDMTVYVVTSGEYSSYGICEMFSTYEQAEKYIASENDRYGWDDYNIEKWEVDNCKIESANPIYYHYRYDIKNRFIVFYTGLPTFKYQDSYIEECGLDNKSYFHYWSRKKNLTCKDIADAYMKWLGENILC